MSIKTRLLLLVLVAAVPVFLLNAWGEIEHRRQLRALVGNQAYELARLIAAEGDRYFETARYVLATLAESAAVLNQEMPACSDLLARLMRKFPAFTGIGAARPDGEIFCSSVPSLHGANLAERDYFQKVLETKDFAIGELLLGRVSGRNILGLAQPVLGAGGALRAVLVVGLDLDRFSVASAVPKVPEGTTITMFDSRGVVLARQPDSADWVGRAAPSGSYIDTVLDERSGVIEADGLDGVRRLIGFYPMFEAQGLYISAGIPTATLFAETEALFWRQVMLLGIVFTVAAAVAYLGGEATIRRPLAALLRTVERLGSGDLQAHSRIASSVPEFAMLGRRFDQMVDSLGQRQSDLRRANAGLEQANEELRRALAEKEILLKEIHHRVRNNLQVMASLLNLQASRVKSPALRAVFQDSLNRINAMGAVHQILYESGGPAQLDLGTLLRRLCANLGAAYPVRPDRVAIHIDVEPVPAHLDLAIPLALIVNELVANALKHAFPNRRRGEIRVRLARDGERTVLVVEDNGVGLPKERAPSDKGLGLVMIDGLVRQIDGTLERHGDGGVRTTVTFPG